MRTDQHAGAGALPGRPATMADVAAKVGVSRQLVSMVFRDAPGPSAQTRERVLRAAEELRYRPHMAAQVLRRSRSRLLGVLFSLRFPFHCDLVEALYAAAQQRGYNLVLGAMTPTRDEAEAIEELLSYRSEALILIGSETGSDRLAALAEQVALVTSGPRHHSAKVDCVHDDDFRGVHLAVDHLVELGHREIVYVEGVGEGAQERREGYGEAMRRHGLADAVRILPGDSTEESGARAAAALLGGDTRPTAVVAHNDQCAVGVLDSFLRAGVSVPGDISVVGYDDSRLAAMSHINLTTVRQDVNEMAGAIVTAVVERLDGGRSEGRELVLQPALVVRGTTAPPR